MQALPRASIFWMLLWCCSYTIAMSCAKLLSDQIQTIMIVCIKTLVSLFYLSPLIFIQGVSVLKTRHWQLMLMRAGFSVAAMLCSYYAYTHLPLTLATSIGFTAPIMVALLAMIVLKEKVTKVQWFAILGGYAGVLIILGPEDFMVNDGFIAALGANFFAGCFIITSKMLVNKEKTATIMLYTALLSAMVATSFAYGVWVTPNLQDFIILLFIGALALISQISYLQAIKMTRPSLLAPLEYTRLLIAIPLGTMVFHEPVALLTLLGGGIIILSNYMMVLSQDRAEASPS